MIPSSWAFPPPAEPTFFNNSYLNTNIVTFLNNSASLWPSSGFGRTAVHQNDNMLFMWPEPFPPNATRYWHCMPCRQRLDSNDEGLNWDACRYGINENLPQLLTVTISLSRSIGGLATMVNNGGYLPAPKDSALMCTYGTPESTNLQPYILSKPFRYVNSGREIEGGSLSYEFNSTSPEGARRFTPTPKPGPYHDQQQEWWEREVGLRVILPSVLGGLLLIALIVGVCCYKKRKNKKIAAKKAVAIDDVAKEEEAAGEVLPSYDGPPAYVEKADIGTKK